jgi:hypothetical protein
LPKQAAFHLIYRRGVRLRARYQPQQSLEICPQLVYHLSGVERHGAPPKDDGFAQNNHPRKSPFFQLFAYCP